MSEEFRMDKDLAPEAGGKARGGKRRRKVSYLTINKITSVDYKDVAVLRRFINERGKMHPARQTGNTAKQQRMITRSIRRARELALLPFVVTEMTNERREYSPRRTSATPRYEAPAEAAPVAEAPIAEPAAE